MSALPGAPDQNSAKIEFATMTPGDIDAVLAVEQSIYAFPWTRGNFSDSLASGDSAWLMSAGGQMLGYAVLMLALDEAQLLNISIVPKHQQVGYGSLLLEHLIVVARRQQAVRMLLEVRASNVFACAFYGRHGFSQIGERSNYYPTHNGREAAIVMEKPL